MTTTAPKIDIRPDHWEIVHRILQTHVPQHEVWAFGSRAKWTAKEFSDLDLAIIGDTPLSLDISASLSDDFSESDLPYKVDVVDWASISETFRKIIERDRVVVQRAGRGANSNWETTTVGQFCPFSYGKALPERDRQPGNFPVISSAGISGTHSKPLVQSAGVVIGRKGTVGSVTFSAMPFWPIDTAFYVADEPEKRDIRFTYYLLKTLQLDRMNSDSAVPGLNRENAHAIPIKVRSNPKEQRKVAGILGNLDDKIVLNHCINQTLEAMAQAIFKSWFVDFAPVKAKIAALAEGRDPLRAAMSSISGRAEAELDALPPEQYEQLAATAALFPNEMEESELGEIPKGWTIQRVGSVLELFYGKALKATDRHEGNVPVYGSGGITGYHNIPLVPHGSIIVGRKGTVGSLYWEDEPFFPIDTTYYVRPLAAPLTFCYYTMQTLGLENMNTDAAVPGLNRENVYRLELILPDYATLQQFDSEATILRKAIRANSGASKSLAILRDTLLPKLLSGELSVSEATAEVEA